MKKITRIGVGGPVGSGKTAVIEAVVPELMRRGVRPLIITNDVVTIDMPYQDILTLIKKFPLPIVITFGPLSDSRMQNIRTVLCFFSKSRSHLAVRERREHLCNFALCSQPILESTSHLCAICERWYCKYHCRRLLYLEDHSPSYICEFCFPLFFQPFETSEPSTRDYWT